MPACPLCVSTQTVKNGRIHKGKQRFKCHDCGRQFIKNLWVAIVRQCLLPGC